MALVIPGFNSFTLGALQSNGFSVQQYTLPLQQILFRAEINNSSALQYNTPTKLEIANSQTATDT
jgi:hypothetical protein